MTDADGPTVDDDAATAPWSTLDNGPEFTCTHFDIWCYENGIRLDFIAPGCPTQNGYIESYNGKMRDECWNENWFRDLEDARALIKNWRADYNKTRPHSSLGNATLEEFMARMMGTSVS